MADLAAQLLAIGSRIYELDARITTTFRAHPQAEIIESLPGMGPILGAELIAAAGDLGGYANAGRLASAAGLVPVPRDSGRRTDNLHRPMRDSRKLRRVFYLSASAAMMREGPNRDYHLTTTSRNADRASDTSKRSSPWPVAASTSYGLCSATTDPSNSPHPCENRCPKWLDKVIENPR